MELIETLNKYFGDKNVIPVKDHDGVFCCEKKNTAQKTYQIVFVDTSTRWCDEDYEQYMESVVADLYYREEGFLQWNFYYYIVTSKESRDKNIRRKSDIENNETYSRKMVFTENEFIDWLNLFESISQISENVITNDLYANWINTLRANKMYFIYNYQEYPNYKQPVDDFINGLESEDVEESNDASPSSTIEPVLQKIDSLDLIKFRKHPQRDNFKLGDVNLITGPNAVGKTSFFDAIELTLTGGLNAKPFNGVFNLIVNKSSSNPLEYPVPSSLAKKRDIDWYNSRVNRGNNLNLNFNRFNYFSSDAAFKLQKEDEAGSNELQAVLSDIALGREVNRLEERILAFKERFENSNQYFLNQLQRLNSSLEEKNDTIVKLTQEKNDPQSYKEILLTTLQNTFWKNPINIDNGEFIAKLDNDIQFLVVTLLNIQTKSLPVERLSRENVLREIEALKLKQSLLAGLRNDILNNQRQRQTYQLEIDKVKSIIPIINEISIYLSHEQISFLEGLSANIKEKTLELDRWKNIKKLAEPILQDHFLTIEENKSKTVQQIRSEVVIRFDKLTDHNHSILNEIREKEANIQSVSKIASDVKAAGQAYISHVPDAENCPLCNTHFSVGQLEIAINRVNSALEDTSDLINLKMELEVVTQDIRITSKQLSLIDDLRKLTLLEYNQEGLDKTILEIEHAIYENDLKISSLTDSLLQLNTIQSRLQNAGLIENRFKLLLSELKEYFSVEIKSNDELEFKKGEILNRQAQSISAKAQLDKDIVTKEEQLQNNFTGELHNEDELSKMINLLQEVENNYKQIEIYLNFPSDTSLTALFDYVNSLLSVFETYKKAIFELRQHNEAIELTKTEKNKIITEIEEDIKPKQVRAQFASSELNNLLTKHSKSEFLKDYINKNKKEIVSIFKIIHNPREFKNINFDNNKISLTTIDDDTRKLNEISSGQRSALALSIFLSLNKQLSKGPQIILFDDPVTYVDDMNILSFFDYLRELVVKTKRQIFYATANDDVAFLFKKKFDFLKDELVVCKLHRLEENQIVN